MEANEILIQVREEIADLKKIVLSATSTSSVSDKWLAKARVMEFLNYGTPRWLSLKKIVP